MRIRSARRRAAPLLAVVLAAAIGSVEAAEPSDADARTRLGGRAAEGLIATHLVRASPDGPVLRRTRVEISRHGRRVTRPDTGERVVANDDLERLWFVDRERRVVHEVPLVASGGGSARSVSGLPGRHAPPLGEVLAPAPCDGARAVGAAPASWRGRPVVRATCDRGARGEPSVELFDAEAGVVVRVLAPGRVEELRDLEFVRLPAERFVPSASLRPVGLRELLEGAAPVAGYVEP